MAKAAAGATGRLAACDEGWGAKLPARLKEFLKAMELEDNYRAFSGKKSIQCNDGVFFLIFNPASLYIRIRKVFFSTDAAHCREYRERFCSHCFRPDGGTIANRFYILAALTCWICIIIWFGDALSPKVQFE